MTNDSSIAIIRPNDWQYSEVNGVLVKHPDLKIARDLLRDQKRCINGPRNPNSTRGRARGVKHGEVVRGGKCQRCIDVHDKRKIHA